MKIGLVPVNVGYAQAEQLVALAHVAEAAGFESVWTFEHVMVPVHYASRYPYAASGKMGGTPETPFIDPLLALATIAAHTTRLRLGTGVNILPQSNPLLLAKQAASLDVLSGGRLMLGLGIGWLREEFVAMGVSFEDRGARFDDYVSAMRKVWSGEVVEHRSAYLDWSGFKSYPRPLQQPLPLIVGGSRGGAFERVARHGDGWFAPCETPAELAPQLDRLRAACRAAGRDFDGIEITAMWRSELGPDTVARMRDIGVHRLIARLIPSPRHDTIDAVRRIGEDVIAKL